MKWETKLTTKESSPRIAWEGHTENMLLFPFVIKEINLFRFWFYHLTLSNYFIDMRTEIQKKLWNEYRNLKSTLAVLAAIKALLWTCGFKDLAYLWCTMFEKNQKFLRRQDAWSMQSGLLFRKEGQTWYHQHTSQRECVNNLFPKPTFKAGYGQKLCFVYGLPLQWR